MRPNPLLSLTAAGLLAGLAACRPGLQPRPAPQAALPAPLVRIQKGDLPILISAPHGGLAAIPGSTPRSGEGQVKGSKGFSAAHDGGTEELALEVAAELERVTGKRPYFVVATFHRRYLDCNRPPAIAYADDAARAVYETYHGAMQSHSREIAARFGSGLVVDLHGQGSNRAMVYRGTKNGLSVTAMRKAFGEGIHEGPQSLLGRLKARGWNVHPEPGGREQKGFSGGFITQTYGGEGAVTDAIQLEFGADYRKTEAQRKATAQVLARVLAEMAQLYRT